MGDQASAIQIDMLPAVESGTAGSAAESTGEAASLVDANARERNFRATRCSDNFTRGLKERESGTERNFLALASPFTIFRIAEDLHENYPEAVKPELVSIGPYHWGEVRLREFEEHKWFFLKSFLRRTASDEKSLVKLKADEASCALGCYSELKMTSNDNFMEIMLLDGCFVVELLLQICAKEDNKIGEYDPILTRQGIIPILIRDLLKLENQVPFPLLQSLFEYLPSTRIEARTPYLSMLALRVFNLVYPGAMALRNKYTDLQNQHYYGIEKKRYLHLLDLFGFTLFPANSDHQNASQTFRPSEKSMPCVTQLRSSGIIFKSKKTERFLDISFRKRVLEIPHIAVNAFMVTVLINCFALEQCQESSSKHIAAYVSFMRCLIKQPKDVSLLYSDGIISTLAHDDGYVVDLFNKLAKSIVFNVNSCYLSKQFEELESYYYSEWATMVRTYFSSPWAAKSACSGFFLGVLTAAQTVYTVLGHYSR